MQQNDETRFEDFVGLISGLYKEIQRIKTSEGARLGLKGSDVMCLYYLERSKDGLTGADLARMAGIAPANAQDNLAAEAFIEWVDRMNATLDIPKYVSGIRRSDIPEMAAHADAEANPLYPVPLLMDRLELEHMYEVVAGGMFEDEN